MPSGSTLDRRVQDRVIAVAIGEGRGPTETARRLARGMDGGAPVDVRPAQVQRLVARHRREGLADVRPRSLASRMLRLAERELAKLEAQRGSLDLDRLDKLAATLRRLDPLVSGQSQAVKPADLRSLVNGGKGETGEAEDGAI